GQEGRREPVTLVVNGEQVWAKFGQRVEDGPPQAVRSFRDLLRAFRYVHALTPLRDPALTLAPLGEIDLEGKAAVGLRVMCKDRQDIHVFLDKATGLPVKAGLPVSKGDGGEATLEILLRDYQEFEGRKHFTKVTVKEDDRVVCEVEFSDIRWV